MEEAYYKLLNDILRGYDRCTPTRIVNLKNNQIFVFGTNKSGAQKLGVANMEARCFGTEKGVSNGPTGHCYALPTLGFSIDDMSKAWEHIEKKVKIDESYYDKCRKDKNP